MFRRSPFARNLARAVQVMWPISAVLLVSAIVMIVVAVGDRSQAPAPAKVVTLGGPGHEKVVLSPDAQAIVKTQRAEDAAGKTEAAESDLVEQQPTDPAAVADSLKLKPAGQPVIPSTIPLATANVEGCDTKLVRNFSSRRGAPVLLGVIHWTGSRPTPGSPASGRAIVSWFDQAAAQASSSEITDQDGRCWLVVPESQKAWTQARFNPWSVSVEIVNQGVQPLFQTKAARAIVVRLMRGWHRRWGIPYRFARVTQDGCRVITSGFLAHRDLGACGGGHPDVGTFDLPGLIREAAGPQPSTSDRVLCRKLNSWRQAGRPTGGAWERNSVARKVALARRGFACASSGPVPA